MVRSWLTLPLALVLFLPSHALAAPDEARCSAPPLLPGERFDRLNVDLGLAPVRADTVWFGGDDGHGVALLGERWDFETPGSNGFQGWRSHDRTENPGDDFARVTAADFGAHGDPCVPIQPGNAGMLWCGIHEDEANLRDFVDGMGYQNMMCQRAHSPIWPIDPALDAVQIAFAYFNHTEPDFDFTHLELLCRDGAGELIETRSVADFDGVIGDPAAPAQFGGGAGGIPPATLPAGTATIQIEVRVTSDGGWSDEDGLWATPCGPFGLDDVTVTVGTTTHGYDFEDGAQGWTFSRCAGAGAFMALHDETTWRDWIEALGLGCACPLEETALGFVDLQHSPHTPPGLAPGQKEEAESGAVPRAGFEPPAWNTAVVEADIFGNFPFATGAHYRPGWKTHPFTSEANPVPHWSPRRGQDVWYYSSSPYAAEYRVNLSTMANQPLPVAWDSLRFTYEVYCSCEAFSTPPTSCLEEGATGGAPLLDHVRIGLTRNPDAPPITLIDGGFFMDSYGQLYPTYLEPSDRGNSNISFDLSMGGTGENDWHGDSAVVTGPIVSSQAGRWLAEICLRIPRTGPRQDLVPEYQAWKARLAGDPGTEWVCVLMDSLETNNHTQIWRNKFATYFHESATGYDPALPDFRTGQEILPDGVFVPGTRIEYYYRSYWYNGGAPPTEFHLLGPREYEILPTMAGASGESYEVQWPCILFVDAYNRGSESYIVELLNELGYSFDRFDYLDNSS